MHLMTVFTTLLLTGYRHYGETLSRRALKFKSQVERRAYFPVIPVLQASQPLYAQIEGKPAIPALLPVEA